MNGKTTSAQIYSITFGNYIGCRSTLTSDRPENQSFVESSIIKLMSHFCLNGSLSSLQKDEWEKYCHPYDEEYHQNFDNINLIAGILGLLTFIIGVFGNLLTLVAIVYAKYKRRHAFHHTFYKTDIWVLHLALCD